MEDELINIDKLRQIFSLSTGERTIEVTGQEYQKILNEAHEQGLEIEEKADSFSLKFGDLTIKIVCDDDEEE